MIKLLTLILFISGAAALNQRPVIGILTLPSDAADHPSTDYSYFPASYVKQIESAGAMVVPIPWDATYEELDFLFERLSGILFTGGDSQLYLENPSPGFTFNKLTDTASFLLYKIIMQNRAGNTYPLMATCQGFQLLNYIISQYYPVLSAVTGDVGVHRVLENVDFEADQFKGFNQNLKDVLQNNTGVYYSHHWGVLPETYEKVKTLQDFFKVTSVSRDAEGLEYIASIEAFDFPIYAYQFHSEKHPFEWNSVASHDLAHVQICQQFANFFVQKARENKNTFPDAEVINFNQKYIIYNYAPVMMMQIKGSTMVQDYFFPRVRQQIKEDSLQLGIKQFQQ